MNFLFHWIKIELGKQTTADHKEKVPNLELGIRKLGSFEAGKAGKRKGGNFEG